MTEEEKKKLEPKQKFAAPKSPQFVYTHLRRKRKRKNAEEAV